jgi:hypothetical protein
MRLRLSRDTENRARHASLRPPLTPQDRAPRRALVDDAFRASLGHDFARIPIHAAFGAGAPLAPELRSYFEQRFGADLGSVRIHTGTAAAQLARQFDARAFALADRVGFDTGEFSPCTPDGRRLLAHEIAHVLQQRRGASGTASAPAALDADADRAADVAVVSDGPASVQLGAPEALALQRRTRSGSSSGWGSSTRSVTSRAVTEARVQSEVTRLRPEIPWAINVPGMMLFDSNFYGDSGLYDFRGHVMSGGELNNYFIAMAMANQGYSWSAVLGNRRAARARPRQSR